MENLKGGMVKQAIGKQERVWIYDLNVAWLCAFCSVGEYFQFLVVSEKILIFSMIF